MNRRRVLGFIGVTAVAAIGWTMRDGLTLTKKDSSQFEGRYFCEVPHPSHYCPHAVERGVISLTATPASDNKTVQLQVWSSGEIVDDPTATDSQVISVIGPKVDMLDCFWRWDGALVNEGIGESLWGTPTHNAQVWTLSSDRQKLIRSVYMDYKYREFGMYWRPEEFRRDVWHRQR